MKIFCISILTVLVSGAALQGRSLPPPSVQAQDLHKLPRALKAVRDLSAILDGPANNHGTTQKGSGPQDVIGGLAVAAAQALLSPQLEPRNLTTLPTRFVKTALRRKVRYGPFDVKANSMSDTTRILKSFCKDCTLLEGRSYIENENGNRQNVNTGIYLHHAIMANMNKWGYAFGGSTSCGQTAPRTPGLVILGLSDSSDTIYTSPDGTFKAGNYLGAKNESFVLMLDIVNYSPQPQKLYLAVEYEYLPGQADGYMDSELQFVSVEVCGNSTGREITVDGLGQFHVPTNKATSVKRDGFTMMQDGILINGLGHFHDGGDNIVLNLNGQTVCDSQAHYGKRPDYVASGSLAPANTTQWATIADMDICSILKPVKKGDVLSVVANYDMTKHPARKGMHGEDEGLMGVVMAQMAVPMKPK